MVDVVLAHGLGKVQLPKLWRNCTFSSSKIILLVIWVSGHLRIGRFEYLGTSESKDLLLKKWKSGNVEELGVTLDLEVW